MISKATTYRYPASRMYNETVATLEDGRVVTINTQYGVVLPHGQHADDCDQINKMGGRCSCGMLDGIDVDALVADARERGLCGVAPKPEATPEERARRAAELDEYERSRREIERAMNTEPQD